MFCLSNRFWYVCLSNCCQQQKNATVGVKGNFLRDKLFTGVYRGTIKPYTSENIQPIRASEDMTIIVNGMELAPNRKKVGLSEIITTPSSIQVLSGPAIEVPTNTRSVCVLQSESCTVPWHHGGVVGSQDATTCVIVFVLCGYGVTVLHFDESTSVSDDYLSKALTGITTSESDVQLHMVGGYDDEKNIGRQVIENLLSFFHFHPVRFTLVTAMVSKLNTRVVDRGNDQRHNAPIYHGACLNLADRQLCPATFADRCITAAQNFHSL